MADYKKLKVWQKAHQLTLRVYKLVDRLPKDEKFGLKSQLTRAAVRCESDLAEGESRYTLPDKINFFVDSRSSNSEIQTQLQIVEDHYDYLSDEACDLRLEYEVLAKQTNSLISYRRNSILPNNPKT